MSGIDEFIIPLQLDPTGKYLLPDVAPSDLRGVFVPDGSSTSSNDSDFEYSSELEESEPVLGNYAINFWQAVNVNGKPFYLHSYLEIGMQFTGCMITRIDGTVYALYIETERISHFAATVFKEVEDLPQVFYPSPDARPASGDVVVFCIWRNGLRFPIALNALGRDHGDRLAARCNVLLDRARQGVEGA